MRWYLVCTVGGRPCQVDLLDSVAEIAEPKLEIRDLPLLSIHLVAELDVRLVLVCKPCLEIVEA